MVGGASRRNHRRPSGYTIAMPDATNIVHAALLRRAPAILLSLALLIVGCESTPNVTDPLGALAVTESGVNRHLVAMEMLDGEPTDEAYLKALHRVVWAPGYSVRAREAAVNRLRIHDLDQLKRTLRQQLPRMTAWEGLSRLCEIIAEQGWVELTPALVSSWARPTAFVQDEFDRPEYLALVRLHGENRVIDVVYDLLVESKKVAQQGLRTRCWNLLHRLDQRDRLIALLTATDVPEDDLFLIDLQTGARELGLIPYNREEILWLRKLLQPERRSFWDEAVEALKLVPAERRETIQMRDLAVIVSAARHDPQLLTISRSALYEQVRAKLAGRRHYSHGSNYDNFNANRRELLHEWRDELTWGDLAAISIALRAFETPQIVAHMYDYALRDREDETTEYGGVIALDHKGRFEILEFPPRVRYHDQKFLASQEMFDAGYTAIFHFHFHVQRSHNDEYAGPGFGDVNYADNTRANCLVLTSVNDEAMNVDFYRHDRVMVDLGVINRP
jgi:hypothetical protein